MVWLDLQPSQIYPWRLDVVYMRLSPVSLGSEENKPSTISSVSLIILETYPNPAKSAMRIRYSLSAEGKVLLQLYDISGRLIKTLVNEEKKPGNYALTFNTKTLSYGVYFLSLQTEDKRIIERLVVVK